MAGVRIVLDTQVWLDWLVFEDRAITALRDAQAAGGVEIVIDADCEAELDRVLGYDLGKRSLDAAGRRRCLERAHALSVRVAVANGLTLPACRDPDDQKLLVLAASARASWLVTRDHALLAMNRFKLPFRIVVPADVRFESFQKFTD